MQPLLNIAVRAARRAGDLIVRNVDRVPTLGVRSKSRNDFVTEANMRNVYRQIMNIMHVARARNGDSFL